jgi:hypothetical protein
MPVPLKFTERATAVMKESLHKQEREPEQVIRSLVDSQVESDWRWTSRGMATKGWGIGET